MKGEAGPGPIPGVPTGASRFPVTKSDVGQRAKEQGGHPGTRVRAVTPWSAGSPGMCQAPGCHLSLLPAAQEPPLCSCLGPGSLVKVASGPAASPLRDVLQGLPPRVRAGVAGPSRTVGSHKWDPTSQSLQLCRVQAVTAWHTFPGQALVDSEAGTAKDSPPPGTAGRPRPARSPSHLAFPADRVSPARTEQSHHVGERGLDHLPDSCPHGGRWYTGADRLCHPRTTEYGPG